MANEYKIFYLRELLQMIDRVALDCLMCPLGMQNFSSCDADKVSRINNDIAWNNEGVRELVTRLKMALAGGDEDAEDDI